MKTMRPFYEEDLLEYEQMLGSQEYWDDLGSWWSSSILEDKIINMGRFLIHGGKLEDAISEERLRRIRPCIFIFLGKLMIDGHIFKRTPLYNELDALSDADLIAKLSKKLIECVKETEGRDANGKRCYNYEIVKA